MSPPKTLSQYPSVMVHVGCVFCQRSGRYRLARLAARYGPEFPLERLLAALSGDCPRSKPAEPMAQDGPRCGACFMNLQDNPLPLDNPSKTVHRVRQPEREDVPQPKRSRTVNGQSALGPTPMLSGWPAPMITIICSRCERREAFVKADVLMNMGDVRLVDLVRRLSANCPRWDAQSIYELCGARFDLGNR